MKQLTIKYPSGLEVNLAAYLLRMTSPSVGLARRPAVNPERSEITNTGTSSSHNHSQNEERHERRSF
jgi:hypothetical protein